MSILIKGIEMPKEGSWKTVRIYPDGTCAVPNWQGDCTLIQGAKAIPVPPHGDLIDRDTLMKDGWLNLHKEVMRMGGYAIHELPLKNPSIPVIIEAEGGE